MSTATAQTACDRPEPGPTVDQAHALMQDHRRCDTPTCPVRQAALTVLVDAGRYVLAAP